MSLDELTKNEKEQILSKTPLGAEYYHFDNKCFIKDIDQDMLEEAQNSPKAPLLINFSESCTHKYSCDCDCVNGWQVSCGWLELIQVLIPIAAIKRSIQQGVGIEAIGYDGELIKPYDTCVVVNQSNSTHNNYLVIPLYFFNFDDQCKYFSRCVQPQISIHAGTINTHHLRRAYPEEIKAGKRLYKTEEDIARRNTSQIMFIGVDLDAEHTAKQSALKQQYVELCCQYFNEHDEKDIEWFSRKFDDCHDPISSRDIHLIKSWAFALFMLKSQGKELGTQNFNAPSEQIKDLLYKNKKLDESLVNAIKEIHKIKKRLKKSKKGQGKLLRGNANE